ncbi:MAG: hypothetical protein ACI965_001201 [Paraglaciecola sp.]|jgi:hypothetical protein
MMMLFVNQSFASNLIPCESMQPGSSQSMLHTQLNMQNSAQNRQHGANSQDMSHEMPADMPMDCCDQDCDCPVAACASIAVLNSISGHLTQHYSAKVLLPLCAISDPFHTPLNKPPIYS